MRLMVSNRGTLDTSVPTPADWYAVVAAVVGIIIGLFALLAVCAFRCYRSRNSESLIETGNGDPSTTTSSSMCSNSAAATGSAWSSVVIPSPFVKPDVEYSSPQFGHQPQDSHSGGFGHDPTGCKGAGNSHSSQQTRLPSSRPNAIDDEAADAGRRRTIVAVSAATACSDEDVLLRAVDHAIKSEDVETTSTKQTGKGQLKASEQTCDVEVESMSALREENSVEDQNDADWNGNCDDSLEIIDKNNKNRTHGSITTVDSCGSENDSSGNEIGKADVSQQDENLNSQTISETTNNNSGQQLTTIQFSIAYDQSRSTLIISIAGVADLHAKTVGLPQTGRTMQQPRTSLTSGHARLEAYVRLGLQLPDGRRFKAKTRAVRAFSGRSDLVPSLTSIDYGETFAFRGVKPGQLTDEARLHLALLSFDRFSRDSVIGDVTCTFDERELAETITRRDGEDTKGRNRSISWAEGWVSCGLNTATISRPLKLKQSAASVADGSFRRSMSLGCSNTGNCTPVSPGCGGGVVRTQQQQQLQLVRGEMLVSVGFQPGAVNRLSVVVLKARNLPRYAADSTHSRPMTDFYVKIYMVNKQGRRIDKKQSRVVRCNVSNTPATTSDCSVNSPSTSVDVVFNEVFYFDLPSTPIRHRNRGGPEINSTSSVGERPRQSQLDLLADMKIEVQLLDWNRASKDDVVGRLIIGPFGSQKVSSTTTCGEGGTRSDARGGHGSRGRQAGAETATTAQSEAASLMLLNAISRDRQVAVWYKLAE